MAADKVRIKQVLEDNKVPLPPDFDERLNLLVMGLRRDPKFETALSEFKRAPSAPHQGGATFPSIPKLPLKSADTAFEKVSALPSEIPAEAPAATQAPKVDSEDWLGPNIVSFLDVVTSPAARGMLKGLFMVIFFVSYLESIPVFGSILAAGLDLVIAGNKMITKTIQKNLPPLIGLIPLPYSSLVGLILAAMYGAFVWPIVAMVAFSRQDFAVAIESFIRSIPPPFGDTIADNFMELNRMAARINAKRVKVVNDITNALLMISDLVSQVTTRIQTGIDKVNSGVSNAAAAVGSAGEKIATLSNRIVEAADVTLPRATPTASTPVPLIPPPAPTPVGQGRKRLTTKRRSKHKWSRSSSHLSRRTRSAKH